MMFSTPLTFQGMAVSSREFSEKLVAIRCYGKSIRLHFVMNDTKLYSFKLVSCHSDS